MGRLDPSDCKFSEKALVFLGQRDANGRKHSNDIQHAPRGLFCFCFAYWACDNYYSMFCFNRSKFGWSYAQIVTQITCPYWCGNIPSDGAFRFSMDQPHPLLKKQPFPWFSPWFWKALLSAVSCFLRYSFFVSTPHHNHMVLHQEYACQIFMHLFSVFFETQLLIAGFLMGHGHIFLGCVN